VQTQQLGVGEREISRSFTQTGRGLPNQRYVMLIHVPPVIARPKAELLRTRKDTPAHTMRYDRARNNLDRHPNYILAAFMASGT
jgi:hypothetical protein